jgi:hypothetical protein
MMITHRHRLLLWLGLVTTTLLVVLPLIDLATADTIGDHVRDAYPEWSADSVAADRAAITGYLAIVGGLGALGWAWALRVLPRRPERARVIVTVMLALGALVALSNVSYGGEAYDTIVPLSYGVLGLVPVLIGIAAVVELWRAPVAPRRPVGVR